MDPTRRLHPRSDLFDDGVGGDVPVLLRAAGFGAGDVSVAAALGDIPERTYQLEHGALADTSGVPVTPMHLAEARLAQGALPTALVLVHVQRRFRNTLWRSLDDHAKYQLDEDSGAPFFESAWMLGRAWVLGETRYLHPLFIEEDLGGMVLPDYGGTDVENYARSRALSQLAPMVRIPEVSGPGSSADLEAALVTLHCPSVESQALDRAALRAVALRHLDSILAAPAARSRPTPRLVNGARQAEEYAAELMESFGFGNVQVTPTGADGGIDVISDEAVAQVKMEGVPTARPVLQAIYGNAAHLGKKALVFSLAGFTGQAVEWAEASGMALFQFSHDGTIASLSSAAGDLEHTLAGPPASPFPDPTDVEDAEEHVAGDSAPAPGTSSLVAQLSELARLRELGALTDEEFGAAKALLLS